MTRDDLLHALQSNNVQAFLRVLRQGESNQNEDAYTIEFGGTHFSSFSDHPRQLRVVGNLRSTAAGAYQFLQKTWDGLVKQYGFPDFSPASQDQAAVALIAGRGALQDVLKGDLYAAIRKCAKEWASLPGSPYGQPAQTLASAQSVFEAYGGRVVVPETQPVQAVPAKADLSPPKVKPMGVFAALLPSILQMIPQLIPLFGSSTDSEVAKRNQAMGMVVADTLVKATNSVDIQQAVGSMLSDTSQLQAASAAINEILPQLVEAGGGGIDGARKASQNPDQPPFHKQPGFWFLVLTLPLIYMLATSVLFGVGGVNWSSEVQVMVATGLIGLLGAGSAFYWGSSFSSQKKDSTIAGMK